MGSYDYPPFIKHCLHTLQTANVDKFEIYHEKSTNLGVEIKDGTLEHLCRATDQGLSIRILKDQKIGFSYTVDLSKDSITKAVQTATEIASLLPSDPLHDLENFSESPYPEIEAYDSQGLQASLDIKIELAKTLEAQAKQLDSRIKRVRDASFDQITTECFLFDSQAESLQFSETVYGLSLTCVAEDQNEAQVGSDSQYTHYFDALRPDSISQQAVANATELLHAVAAPTMQCPVVFKNSVTVQLLRFLAASFSAENIDKKFSILVDKKGQRIFSDKITLIDDGLYPNGLATSPFDGEGTPMRTKTLVSSGILQDYLYDGYYARKFNTKPTGNARRGLKSPPSIGPTNFFMKPGKRSLDKLFSEIKKGVYITEVMGLHTANPITGDFSLGASGILIENGILTQPIKGFTCAGNLLNVFERITQIGSDLKFWGSFGAPSLFISELSIGGN